MQLGKNRQQTLEPLQIKLISRLEDKHRTYSGASCGGRRGRRQITWKAEVSQKKADRRRPRTEARRRDGRAAVLKKFRVAEYVTNSNAGLQHNLLPNCDDAPLSKGTSGAHWECESRVKRNGQRGGAKALAGIWEYAHLKEASFLLPSLRCT